MTQTLNGTAGPDTLTGTNPLDAANPDGIDIINGGAGNDTLSGLGGDDTIQGGLGADIMDGGAGFDTLSYAAATAAVWLVLNGATFGGEAVGDTMTGFEAMIGSAFNDILTGDGGANILDGRNGGDVLDGGAGDDRLRGGATGDVLRGGAGADTAVYDDATGALTVNLQAGTTGGWAQGDVLTRIENLIGSAFADTLRGEGGVNILDGSAGDDLLEGRAGADTLQGGAGIDTATYVQSTAGVTVDLASGVNSGGEAQGDVLQSIENLTGSAFADTLRGDAGANGLDGGAGADLLDGGAGIDTARYSASAAAVTVDLRIGTGTGGDAQGDVLQNIENIVGSAFADILQGSAAANVLSGGDGDDLINGYGGADALDGGAGIDTVYYNGSAAAVTVDLRTGTGAGGDAQGDVLTGIENIIGSAFADLLRGNAGTNAIDGGAGIDMVSYSGSTAGVTVDLAAGTGTGGDAQGDTLSGIENVTGSAFDDLFAASAAANFFAGGDGTDTVSYAQSTARVIVRLNEGRAFEGWAQGDTFSAQTENVIGSAFNDILTGNGNDAAISLLDGGAGDDALAGDGEQGAGGADILIGGTGNDTAYYDNSGGAVQVSLTTGTGTGGDAEGDTLTGIENLVGSNSGDTLTGDGGSNRLDGGAGNDVLAGEAGADTLIGGTGFDTASYGRSAVGVQVDLTTGICAGGDAQGDTLSGIEFLVGSGFDDVLTGNNGGNSLSGGGGNDLITGDTDADFLDGGAGIDTANYDGSAGAVTINLASGQGLGGDAQGDVLAGIENLIGSGLADTLIGDGNVNTLTGGAGGDILVGGAGADALDGGAGTDTARYNTSAAAVTLDLGAGTASGGDAAGDRLTSIEWLGGSAFNDVLTGNAGVNQIAGGGGADTIAGAAGNDTVFGGNGNDQVDGGDGWDILLGDAGDDQLAGGAGGDTLRGGLGADRLAGGADFDTASYWDSAVGVTVNLQTGVNTGGTAQGDTIDTDIELIHGSNHDDVMTGNALANALLGFDGNDALGGGGGADVLRGGAGADTLNGGAGNDFFSYTAVSDSTAAAADTIQDFQAGTDLISLREIDADGNAANGDTAFSFIGAGLYTGVAGQLRYAVGGGQTVIAGDVNGDGVSDFRIVLTGSIDLVAGDFLL
ncbi:MAG: beta strand repeat-containing protein [Inquilinus sp.]|uniref:beta strand repeat-containing protein n=1 Tax=Inquilinus sp. TaxID=1932117 RepID=UPI003F340125